MLAAIMPASWSGDAVHVHTYSFVVAVMQTMNYGPLEHLSKYM